MSNISIPTLVPAIIVNDISAAIKFYTKFGFEELKQFSFPDETGRLIHAHLTNGSSVLFLGVPDVSYYPDHKRAILQRNAKPSERGVGITFILQTDDLDKMYEAAKSLGVEILAEPAEQWHGDKVFLFIDPYGYEWKLSQPMVTE